ncbi:BrxE family protein [Akkermansiaceae bacterium]|nr:BrxE family protein [Akkermansiaceae bacterium]
MATLTDHTYLLTHLRLAVLIEGEKQPDLWWSSAGLSPEGQQDLIHIFPRTALTAAATHAQALALAHHDKNTRARGVYHLFRLPTVFEETIHRELIDQFPENKGVLENPWAFAEALDLSPSNPSEGATNLGTLDLHSQKDLALLASTYKAAIDAGISTVPFFELKA